MKRAHFIVGRLDYYDLHYKLHISRGDNTHWIDDSEKRALAEEHARRQVTLEGFGYGRPEPTPHDQKKREADQMVERMSSRWLQIHSEYIMQGSGAYNEYQREAVYKSVLWRIPRKSEDGFCAPVGAGQKSFCQILGGERFESEDINMKR
ncbi:hypothetical protein N7516_003475 [Penicillium verrucosum]|uniref:uncharacterized protein n=1 Tax=Penicillium verrucosum TaxID=60171 RepID=UPI002545B140|nr:uncharacterized protein N7516_003475 [Penicillium verrucosum]KAJ5943307.1 hypothetical protein N7516_003475 [Penicillium verrucosum]